MSFIAISNINIYQRIEGKKAIKMAGKPEKIILKTNILI
jgi:hypothetical protein